MRLVEWLDDIDPDFVYKLKNSNVIVALRRCENGCGTSDIYTWDGKLYASFIEFERRSLDSFDVFDGPYKFKSCFSSKSKNNSLSYDDCIYNDGYNRNRLASFVEKVKDRKSDIKSGCVEKLVTSLTILNIMDNGSNLNLMFSNAVYSGSSAEIVYLFKDKTKAESVEDVVWMGASPELLFKKYHDSANYEALALAGTMSADSTEGWSEKNIEEHNLVINHFKYEEEISSKSNEMSYNTYKVQEVSRTREVKYGNIKHLATDIRISFEGTQRELINIIHPTPAVCGFPKANAKIIIKKDHCENDLYAGVLAIKEPNGDFFSFVNLRCFKANSFANKSDDAGKYLHFRVGAGIVADSDAYEEMHEVVSKYKTVRDLFGIIDDEALDNCADILKIEKE